MSRLAILAMCLFMILSSHAALGDQNDERLVPLFKELRESSNSWSARVIEGEIWKVWGEAEKGEPTRLFEKGNQAMSERDFLGAIEDFSSLIEIAPDFAEAWNKRATVYYLVGEFDLSIADIQATLALEPRHFGALSGLGLIMMRLEQPDIALKSFKAAIELHPHMPAAKAHIELLSKELQGAPL